MAARQAMGERLWLARRLVVPSRHRFALGLGVDVTTIRNIEHGKKSPSIWLLYRICHALRIDLGYLAEGRLIGVDPELRELLVQEHPRLAEHWLKEREALQQAELRHGTGRNPHNKPHFPTIRVL